MVDQRTGLFSEKRYLPRWQVKNRILYRVDGDAAVYEGRSIDLSGSGASMLTVRPVSQRIKLSIYLSDEEIVELHGQPVWSRAIEAGHVTGIVFTDANSEIQDKILRHAFEIIKDDINTTENPSG